MSRKYKFNNSEGIYFVSFATVNWIDVFIRREYKDIIVDSLNYCIEHKGLIVYSWVIMSNHVHLVIEGRNNTLDNILRDLKRHTAQSLLKAIQENPQESRKDWMIWLFQKSGSKNSNNERYQFWQQHNQPIELSCDSSAIDSTIDYIHNNPVKAGFVDDPVYYAYSSAVDFAGGKGLVNITPC